MLIERARSIQHTAHYVDENFSKLQNLFYKLLPLMSCQLDKKDHYYHRVEKTLKIFKIKIVSGIGKTSCN